MHDIKHSFFFMAITSLVVYFLLWPISNNLNRIGVEILNVPQVSGNLETDLAHYYWARGNFQEATKEYKNLDTPSLFQKEELLQLLHVRDSIRGRLTGLIFSAIWAATPYFFFLSILFFGGWFVLMFLNLFRKEKVFAIMNFDNYSALNIGENFSQTIVDRMRSLVWQMEQFNEIDGLISYGLEMPSFGIISDKDAMMPSSVLETVVMASQTSKFPLMGLIESAQLWLLRPRYVVRGYLDQNRDKYFVHMVLASVEDKNKIDSSWSFVVDTEHTLGIVQEVVDTIAYPLLSRFGEGDHIKHWRAIRAMQNGLREYKLFEQNERTVSHLRQSLDYFKRCNEIDPDYEIGQYNFALILLKLGEYNQAKEKIKKLMASTQDDALRLRLKYHYGVSLFHISQYWAYKQAIKVFREIDNANIEFDKIDAFKNIARSSLAITLAKMSEQDLTKKNMLAHLALEEAGSVLSAPNSPRVSNVVALAAQGYALFSLRKYDQAVLCFQKSLQKNTTYVPSLVGIGNVYSALEKYDEAIDFMKRAEENSISSDYASYCLGNIYQRKEKMVRDEFEKNALRTQAIEAYSDALTLPRSRIALGKIYQEDSRHLNKALYEFRSASQSNPRLSESWVNIAWTILEMSAVHTVNDKLLAEAEDAARRALQLDQNNKQTWHRQAVLARTLLSRGKNEKALKVALEANKKIPNQGHKRAQVYCYLAIAQFRLGQHDNAKESLQKMIRYDTKGEWYRFVGSFEKNLVEHK